MTKHQSNATARAELMKKLLPHGIITDPHLIRSAGYSVSRLEDEHSTEANTELKPDKSIEERLQNLEGYRNKRFTKKRDGY